MLSVNSVCVCGSGQPPLTGMLMPLNSSLLLSYNFHRMAASVFPGDDAKEAIKRGVDGILVSNHGARQLDGVPATVSLQCAGVSF